MGTLIVFRSKYGSTKRYAEWIAQKLGADVFSVAEFDVSQLGSYETVLFGSSVHVGRIKGIGFIKNNWNILSQKRVVVFASTGTPKIDAKQQQVIEASLPPDMYRRVKYFPLPGAYNYSKLDFTDKLLMNLGPRLNLRFRAWFRGDSKAKRQLAMFTKTQDWTSIEAINPIVDYLKRA